MDEYTFLEDMLNDIFDETPDEEVIRIWNDYAQSYDDPIYFMSDFDEIIQGQYSFSPFELLDAVVGTWDGNAEYFTVDDLNLIRSFDDLLGSGSPFDRGTLINYIIENNEDFGNEAIANLLSGEGE